LFGVLLHFHVCSRSEKRVYVSDKHARAYNNQSENT